MFKSSNENENTENGKTKSTPEEQNFIRQTVGSMAKRVKEMDSPGKIAKEDKELHAAISKIGKTLEKVKKSPLQNRNCFFHAFSFRMLHKIFLRLTILICPLIERNYMN